MKRDPRVYLAQILEGLRQMATYTMAGKEKFFADEMMQDAVIRKFEVIGEAAKRVSDEYRQAHPEIRWRELGAFGMS